MSLPPRDERFLEDYRVGDVIEAGDELITAEEIVAFAGRYDPQEFHLDPEEGERRGFGGLIASGWMTCGVMMRILVRDYLPGKAGLASPGLDELRWTAPVRPGDRLRIRSTVTDARRSRSKPDRGVVLSTTEVLNQDGKVVLTVRATNLMLARDPA